MRFLILFARNALGVLGAAIGLLWLIAVFITAPWEEGQLHVCRGIRVSNAPAVDDAMRVRHYHPQVEINGVALAANPTRGACLSSGFGPRDGRMHQGLDYFAGDGGPIRAAGDGAIAEMRNFEDYGNMVLIDHGQGVFTRYAHLAEFRRGLAIGARVRSGEVIGAMGNTSRRPIAVHLHYEVLTGDYDNPRASFGLTPVDPLSLPPAE
jgi:murein DD-endopeptidase MepM/ murein hydrolase activator NlpD